MSNLIRKISAKSVCGKMSAPKKATPLYVVLGIATKTKSGQSDFGEWTALVGQFEATNMDTGEVYQAPQCFLPEPLNSMLAESLNELDDDENRVNASVQFAVEVGFKPSDTPIGYEYTTKEIVEADTADPLAALRDASAKALPAPTKKKGNNKKS
jgi:hypothetical protein